MNASFYGYIGIIYLYQGIEFVSRHPVLVEIIQYIQYTMSETLIYTLQFPDFGQVSRKKFLSIVHRYVFTFALQRQDLMAQMGGCAGYFHTQKHDFKTTPILIHSLQKDGIVTLRAYTQKAATTLALWYTLFKEAHPEWCTHVIETTERYTPVQLTKPQQYQSTNWIPYRNVQQQDGQYIDKDRDREVDFTSRSIGNMRTFVNNIYPTTSLQLDVTLTKAPTHHDTVVALIKRKEAVLTPIHKYAFTVTLTSNISLPLYFSLGQNVSYGNGIFERVY